MSEKLSVSIHQMSRELSKILEKSRKFSMAMMMTIATMSVSAMSTDGPGTALPPVGGCVALSGNHPVQTDGPGTALPPVGGCAALSGNHPVQTDGPGTALPPVGGCTASMEVPASKETLATMIKVNDYFMGNWPDPTKPTFVKRERSSNLWTRAVYYEGLMALIGIHPADRYLQYVTDWGDFHQWKPRNGNTDTNADNYCCSQTYIDMYRITHDWEHIKNARLHADMLVNNPDNSAWTWIDAIQMGMPVLTKLAAVTGEQKYSDKAWEMYAHTRNVTGGGLFNEAEGLWWRDADFVPPYTEPNGEDCYWSRGNGWVYAALARVMDDTPVGSPHREDYEADFRAMSRALIDCQREDGFWNCSLHDPDHFGGKELTGTALFVYGMAWGLNNGLLDAETYLEPCLRGWYAMVGDAVHPDGYLGYVQGTGKEPKDGQPTAYDSRPDFDDYGTGCFLLAGSEVYKLRGF